MAWMGLHYGVFPYPQLTVVSPPPEARDAGGMEYPTFITTGADRYAGLPPLSWKPDLESVTVHEFAHQYFQSLLASNEFAPAFGGSTNLEDYRWGKLHQNPPDTGFKVPAASLGKYQKKRNEGTGAGTSLSGKTSRFEVDP